MLYNSNMTPERKAAYRHLIYLQVVRLRNLGGNASGSPLSFWNARSLHNVHQMADGIHNLAWFSAREFDGFDEDRFWKQRNIGHLRGDFQRFEVGMRRQLETGEWMPKSFQSTAEITQCFHNELENGLTPEGYARLKEAVNQLKDFPIDYECVLAGIKLVEKTTDSKMMTGPYKIVYYELESLRYEDAIYRAQKERPECWVPVKLLREYERQRGTLRV